MVNDQPFATKTDSALLCLSAFCATTTVSIVPAASYIAARDTTTGNACPAGITIGPGDDEGDFPEGILLSDIGVTQTFTSPESVLLAGSTYTVTSGSITISNTAVNIPSLKTASVITLIGLPATVMPGYTGVSMSITRTDWVPVVSVSTMAAVKH